MKSKTLQLIARYQTILEQDEQNPEAGMEQAPPQEGQEPEMPVEQPETIPLSSTSEIRYIQDVVLALLYGELSENDTRRVRPDRHRNVRMGIYQHLPVVGSGKEGMGARNARCDGVEGVKESVRDA